MATQLDVYRDWLGIADPTRPLNYYALLRLKKFEDDAALIRAHYRKLNAHVKKYAAGEFQQQSQALLNELAKAMLCLTDTRRKGEYDVALGREAPADGKRMTFEQILLRRKVLDPEKLEKARKFSTAVGVDLQDAVVQQKLAAPDLVMQSYAESLGLPYVDLSEMGVAVEVVDQVPAVLARKNSCIPILTDGGVLLMASPRPLDPAVEDELRLRTGMPVRTVLCTAAGISSAIDGFFSKERLQAEMSGSGDRAVAGRDKAAAADTRSPEEIAQAGKQRNLMALMAFNFSFMACIFYMTVVKTPHAGFFKAMGLALPIGAAVASSVWIGLKLSKK